MKITIIGTGYVGIITGVCLAEINHQVICVDKDHLKIDSLKKGVVDIYEPHLKEYLTRNTKKGNLTFTTDIDKAIQESAIIFIAVGTPENADGTVNLDYVFKVVESIKKNLNDYKIIVNKSTVPVGTGEKVKELLKGGSFDVVSNPEFLKEGTSIADFMKPDRIVLGCDNDEVFKTMEELYAPFILNQHPILKMNLASAEMTKYGSNAFLATKISFMNELSRLCEKVGANIGLVRQGMSKDHRIGEYFLHPGIGYGGSCFPKDVQGLIHQGKAHQVKMSLLEATHRVNEEQKGILEKKIIHHLGEDLSKTTFAIWGLSFKPETDDIRNASSLVLINALLKRNAKINVHDPKAMDNVKKLMGNQISYYDDHLEATRNADALILTTEWLLYRNPDLIKLGEIMNQKIIFDGRNILEKQAKKNNFKWFGIGIPS